MVSERVVFVRQYIFCTLRDFPLWTNASGIIFRDIGLVDCPAHVLHGQRDSGTASRRVVVHSVFALQGVRLWFGVHVVLGCIATVRVTHGQRASCTASKCAVVHSVSALQGGRTVVWVTCAGLLRG